MALRVRPTRNAGPGTQIRLSGFAAGVAALVAAPVGAAPVATAESAPSRGAPIAQNFLEDHGDNISLVATPTGVSCVASRPLPIRESLYAGPEGQLVPFAEISRSPASSIQAIARAEDAVAFRVQLKYTPDPAHPILLKTGSETLDLSQTVEPSRDSLWLTGDAADALAQAFAAGLAPSLRAISAGTGRQITDRIDSPAMAGLDQCMETLAKLEAEDREATQAAVAPTGVEIDIDDNNEAEAEIETAEPPTGARADDPAELALLDEPPAEAILPVPVAGVRLELIARADPDTRLTEEQLEGCRMRDIPETLYLGRLTSVTGFFSQTRDAYVAFDGDERLQRVYVPGIFDSDVSEGTNSARLSLAADSNLPDAPNMVRGCLGDAQLEAPICVYPGEEDGAYVLAECGVLGVSDERDELFFPSLFTQSVAAARAGSSVEKGTFLASSTRFGPGIPSISPPGGGSARRPVRPPLSPEGPDDPPPAFEPDPEDPTPHPPSAHPIPLPAAIWLLLGGLGLISGLRYMARGRRV